jgi:hypothetical protein
MASMSSTPPEPDFGVQADTSATPGQFAAQGGQRAARRMSVPRTICGVIWAVIAIICGVGGVLELTISNTGGAILSFVIAVLAGWYDYRVWTFRARLLVLILGSVREGPVSGGQNRR